MTAQSRLRPVFRLLGDGTMLKSLAIHKIRWGLWIYPDAMDS